MDSLERKFQKLYTVKICIINYWLGKQRNPNQTEFAYRLELIDSSFTEIFFCFTFQLRVVFNFF
jgi:hypothetical protein